MGAALSDITLSKRGGSDPIRLPTTDTAVSWRVSQKGALSAFLTADAYFDFGLTDTLGMWAKWAGMMVGRWAGIITAERWKAGKVELVGETNHALIQGRRTARSYRSETAPPGAHFLRLLSDIAQDDPGFIALRYADETGQPIPVEWRGEDAFDVVQDLAGRSGMEWWIDEDRNAAFRQRIGSDLSATVQLVEGVHITGDPDLQRDLWTLINDYLGVAGNADYERSQAFILEDKASIQRYGRYASSLILPDLADRSAIEPATYAALQKSKNPKGTLDCTLDANDVMCSRFREGDSIRVQLRAGVKKVRVLARDCDVGAGTLNLSCNVEEDL